MAQRAPGQSLSRRAALASLAGAALACRPRSVPSDLTQTTGPSGQLTDFGLRRLDFSALAGFCDGVPAISDGERSARITRAQTALRAAGHHALITEAGATLEYFTGVTWHRSERPLLLVLRADAPPALVGPAFETHTLRERSPLTLLTWAEHASPYARVGELLAEVAVSTPSLALEPTTRMFVLEGLRRDVPNAVLVDGGPVVRACRSTKSPAELALLRRANEATKLALRSAATHVRADMLEAELSAIVEAAQLAAGLASPWALVLFGSNAAFPHGTRGARHLARGELVLVDCGASLHGYQSGILIPRPMILDAYACARSSLYTICQRCMSVMSDSGLLCQAIFCKGERRVGGRAGPRSPRPRTRYVVGCPARSDRRQPPLRKLRGSSRLGRVTICRSSSSWWRRRHSASKPSLAVSSMRPSIHARSTCPTSSASASRSTARASRRARRSSGPTRCAGGSHDQQPRAVTSSSTSAAGR